ncbi:gluconokinase [Hyphococcus luteus]|nr:gluconokinase, GntK/IdnK-type [Marinicaulis flavus]
MKTASHVFIVMGVAGAGKTTLAAGLAARFGGAYLEGDDFHPAANVEKMTRGEPLTEKDRAPWIDALADAVNKASGNLVFASCSALTPGVRRRLRESISCKTDFLFLDAPEEMIARRLERRPGHFMKAGMLRSQFRTLLRPQNAIVIDANLDQEDVIAAAAREVEARLGPQ